MKDGTLRLLIHASAAMTVAGMCITAATTASVAKDYTRAKEIKHNFASHFADVNCDGNVTNEEYGNATLNALNKSNVLILGGRVFDYKGNALSVFDLEQSFRNYMKTHKPVCGGQ